MIYVSIVRAAIYALIVASPIYATIERPRRIWATVEERELPISGVVGVQGNILYNSVTGALLYDSVTGAAICA